MTKQIPISGSNLFALVDEQDYEKASKSSWSLSNSGYPRASISGNHTYLHHLVAGIPPKGQVIDHINGDKLDCCRINLRYINRSANVARGRSNTKGYYFSEKDGLWYARARINGIRHMQCCKTENEAIEAVKKLRLLRDQ